MQSLIENFVHDVCAGKTNETPTSYRRKLQEFARWLGDAHPNDITAERLREFQRHLLTRKEKRRGSKIVKERLSLWTVRSVLVTVKHFCRWLHRRGLMAEDVAAEWVVPQPPPPDPKPVSQKTVDALLHAAAEMGEPWERLRNLAFIYCLRDTGGRLGALLAACIHNVDLQAGEIVTVSKARPGTLYINPPTALILREWIAVRATLHPHTDRLFINRHGQALTRSGVYWMMHRLADEAGCADRHNPHAWRHAFVRDVLKSRKADLSQASRLLWHTTIRTTADYYARWDDAELKRVHGQASPGASLPMPSLSYS